MDFFVHPLKGVNDIEFGMRGESVREIVNGELISGDIRATSRNYPTDYFNKIGMFAYYDAKGHLEGLEFHEPARVFLGGVNLLSLHRGQAMALLTKLDPNFLTDADGADFRSLSIGIYAPGAGDEDGDEGDVPVESVLVARAGYYDLIDESDE